MDDDTFPRWFAIRDQADAGTAALDQFNALFKAHATALMAHLRRLAPKDVAEDIAQEAWCRLYQQLLKGRTKEDPRAWLRKVAYNLLLNRIQHDRRWKTEDVVALADDLISEAPTAEQRIAYFDSLATLEGREYVCFTLLGEGYPVREIANDTGHSVKQVEGYIRRAREKMRKKWGEKA